jgi:predicted amidophosphoribosyltransferase
MAQYIAMNMITLSNLFLRRRCVGCQRVLHIRSVGVSLCSPCANQLPGIGAFRCRQCANRMEPSVSKVCETCAEPRSSSHLRSCYAASCYLPPSTAIVSQLKTYGNRRIAEFAARQMAQCVSLQSDQNETCLVVPIPSARGRWLERGFNPAQLLVRPLIRELTKLQVLSSKARADPRRMSGRDGLRFEACFSLVSKIQNTEHQIGLSRGQRQKNLKGAYSIVEPKKIQNTGILLVDDVMTTGATAEAVAKTLRDAGASWVDSVVFARTPKF